MVFLDFLVKAVRDAARVPTGKCSGLSLQELTSASEHRLSRFHFRFSKMGPSRPQKRVHGKKRWEKEEEKHRLECWIDQLDPRK